jgi:serine phosphatase RsbU (regulator of sigma subunit)
VTGENEEFVGVLAGMFRLGETGVSPLYASIVRLRSGDTGNTYIVDGQGRILYDSSQSQVGETLPLPQQAELSPQGYATRTRNAAGNDVIASYALVPGTPWTLISEDLWDIATRNLQRFARTFLVLLGLGMALPALGVTLLIRQQGREMQRREQTLEEQRVSGLIQRQLLPQTVPMLAGWGVGVCHRPDPKPGGDFHDLFLMPDGRLALTLGQMGDAGLAASHILSTVRAALRGAARLHMDPGSALSYANALLCPEVQPDGCVALLYGVLDPSSATLYYACAGTNQPWRCGDAEISEPQVMGTPLGTSLDAQYEPHELILQPGESVVFYSDGLWHAHDAQGTPFGLSRTCAIIAAHGDDVEQAAEVLESEIKEFTDGSGAEPEDVTAIILQRLAESPVTSPARKRKPPVQAEPVFDWGD